MTSNGEKEPVSKFELSREVSSHYFKSSFARSMFSNSNQSKSLDFVYFDNSTIDEENENDCKTPTDDINTGGSKPFTSPLKRVYSTKLFDQKYEPEFLKTNSARNQNNNAISYWKRKQQEAAAVPRPRDNSTERGQADEIATLKKECQRLVEENQRLQQTMDNSHLQTQVDTLQWQLKQAESSRQMYRAVLEQVSRFLERVHKNLDQVNGKPPPSKCKGRVPRSRSVHTVASCPSNSRPVSPSPSTIGHSVQRANSISQIQDSHTYSMFRDISWRTPRGLVEEVPPEKLSQEAFRLLRTVQSLLGTREPDLAHRLTPAPTPTPLSDSDSSRDTTWCVGSCSSLLPHLCSNQRKSLDASSCSSRVEGEGEGGNPSTPQLSVGSAEDESGFSSMSSFHEVGLPEIRSYPEVGLPLVEPSHRRWSSTPVRSNSSIQVLWV
uniref:Uncharacterized protein n=1 Tax=Homalodisca liturata TaxID=320908 RepID=A0A1B6IRX9_9HEMI